MSLQSVWPQFEKHLKVLAVIPFLVGIVGSILSGKTWIIVLGAIWFLLLWIVSVGVDLTRSLRNKWRMRAKRDAVGTLVLGIGPLLSACPLRASLLIWCCISRFPLLQASWP